MDSYHKLINESDLKKADCFDENREFEESKYRKDTQSNTKLSSKILSLIFAQIFITNILINFDHGTIPAALTEIKTDINLSNANIGILGSLVYIGLTVGSLIASSAFSLVNPKYVIGISLILNSLSLLIFPMFNNFFYLCISRTLVGFFQTFCCIYIPVWIDMFAPIQKKTIWLTLTQLAVPLGIVIGYCSTAVLVSNLNWRISFYAQCILITPFALLFFLYPSKYFNKHGLKKNEKHDFRKNGWISSEDYSYAYEGETGGPRTPGFCVKSCNYYDSLSTCQSLKIILKNKVFVFLTLATSCLYFIITGIQFWITDYMLIVLKIDQSKAFITFSVICVTAPCFGIITGGVITHNMGGYHAPGILKIPLNTILNKFYLSS